MFLSALRVDRRHPDASREWRDLCAMHSRVVDATVGMPDGGPRVLWAQPYDGVLVVRSPEPVTAARLPRGWASKITHRVWDRPAGGTVRAVVVVNPTRSVRTYDRPDRAEGYRKVRKPIVGRDEQLGWISGVFGPAIVNLTVRVVDERVRKGWHRSGNVVVHRMLTVELSGTVADHALLVGMAEAGVGGAKAYGGGLSVWQALC